MNTEKHALIAQVIEAMGIIDRDEKIKLVKDLIAQWGLDYSSDIRSNQPTQKPKAPEGFTLDHCSGLPIAIRKNKVMGAVFCLEGKHFIFAFKSKYKMTLLKAQKAIKEDKYGTIDGYHWIIPTVSMFTTVQEAVQQFNVLANTYGGDMIYGCEYLDASMTDPCKIATLRLAMWAPWLD